MTAFRSSEFITGTARRISTWVRAGAGAALVAAVVSACGTSRPDYSSYVYPPPPDTAHYALTAIWHGQEDFSHSFFDVILGRRKSSSFVKPVGIAYDTAGNIAVADAMAGGILYFDLKNERLRTITNSEFKLPLNIAFTSRNVMYVADGMAQRVFEMNADGAITARIGRAGQMENPVDIAIDERSGKLYVVDSHRHAILVYNMQGDSIGVIGSRGDGPLQFNYPTGIALDSAGTLYVVDALNFRVQVITSGGTFVRSFGSAGDGFGQFTRPRSIALDREGNIYVTDAAFCNFQVFRNDGVLLTYVGRGGASPAEFNQPAGIACDGKDQVAVVDQINRRIQVFHILRPR